MPINDDELVMAMNEPLGVQDANIGAEFEAELWP